jgi:hypothetical protein
VVHVALVQLRAAFGTIRVLRNTFAMSGLGLATSWLPVAFAFSSPKSARVVQEVRTNFYNAS